jgi:hypothetical protein
MKPKLLAFILPRVTALRALNDDSNNEKKPTLFEKIKIDIYSIYILYNIYAANCMMMVTVVPTA